MDKGEPTEIENQRNSEFMPEKSFWWMKFVPQPNIWTNVNIFRFLRLYQTYPLLWDPSDKKYSKSSERSEAYREISQKLNLQGIHEKECMKLIESLKQIYLEEKQKKEEAKTSVQKYKPPPIWFQILNDIVENIINNEKEKASSSSNITNEIKTEFTKLIKCFKNQRENIWTPNYLKTDLWKWSVPKKSHVTEKGNIKKRFKNDNKILNNKDSNSQSCQALKPSKPNHDSKFQNISHNSSPSVEDIKKYCPDFDKILCNCSSHSIQKVKKYCPEFKNILCDCSSKSSQNIKKYCPEFKNIFCDFSSKSSQNIEKYCPEFENIVCDCSSETKYLPENKSLEDYFSKSSSDSKMTRDSDSRILIDKFTFTNSRRYNKKYENPYADELDRYCYYKDWNKYYNIKICDFKENSEEPFQPEKKTDVLISNKNPPRPHKNNILESDINLFTDMKRNYEFQRYDCIKIRYKNF